MTRLTYFLAASALALTTAVATTRAAGANPASSPSFDYQFGVWRVHVSRLINPGAQLGHWTQYDGTHTVAPLLSGRANIGVLEIAGAKGTIEGLQLRTYDPLTGQWKLSFASGDDGEVQPAAVGRFVGNRGAFFDSERIAGHRALVRTETTVQSASTYRDTISYSTNAGKSWQPLWIASYTKATNDPSSLDRPAGKAEHDFDFQVGSWRVGLARLAKRLSGSHAWRDYTGSLVVRRLWNGRANVGVLEVRSGKDSLESILLRTFDPQTSQWRDYGVTTADGSVGMPPTVGRFSARRGVLYDHEMLAGRPILVRGIFDNITAQSNRFVQSFSADDGRSWEPNLIVHFSRAAYR